MPCSFSSFLTGAGILVYSVAGAAILASCETPRLALVLHFRTIRWANAFGVSKRRTRCATHRGLHLVIHLYTSTTACKMCRLDCRVHFS
jgi:hypothetical protein